MQDGSRQTVNNMQANNKLTPVVVSEEEAEPTILPGPSALHWRKVIPNSLTALATMVGLSSVNFGMEGHFEMAVLCIMMSGMLDGLDGPAARALNGTSRFGAEFDSLSDYVNFGVAPAFLMYFWSLKTLGWYGWITTLIYTVCMGMRLARFNAGVDFNASKVTRNFFMGVPAPAGAMLIVLPMICTFQFGTNFGFHFGEQFILLSNTQFTVPYTLVIAFFLISRLPTFSSKAINRTLLGKLNIVKMFVVGVVSVVVIAFFLKFPWSFLIVSWTAYILSIPVSWATFHVLSRREDKEKTQAKKQS